MDLAAYPALFLISMGAATILPFQSEWAVVALLVSGDHPWATVVAVASLGNVLGSVINWFLGRSLLRFQDRRWFPVSPRALRRADGWYRRYGRLSLLLSWVPLIGDPLTIAAGVLREPLASFVVIVAIAKTGRYLVLAAVTLNWMGV